MKYLGRSWQALIAAFSIVAAVPAAQAVVTRTPYQQYVYKFCAPGECVITLANLAANYRIELDNISCYLSMPSAAHIDFLRVYVQNGTTNLAVVALPMVQNSYGDNVSYAANTYTSIFLSAGQHFKIAARPLVGRFLTLACNLSGERVKLS